MGIKNLSNYRVGKTYEFKTSDGNKIVGVVKNKSDRKLLLSVNNQENWYNCDQLSPAHPHTGNKARQKNSVVAEKVVEKSTKTAEQPKIAAKVELKSQKVEPIKPVATPKPIVSPETLKVNATTAGIEPKIVIKSDKNLLNSSVDFEKELKDETINDYKYLAQCLKRDIRVILKQKGYQYVHTVNKDTPVRELLGLIQNYLPEAKGGKR